MSLIQYLTRIQFGFGAISLLGDEIRRLGASNPLVITDRGIAEAGILDRVLSCLGASRHVLYDRATRNPSESSLKECLELWTGEECDCAVAAGGGSVLDLSKAVALLASHGGEFADYGVHSDGLRKIGKVAPHIAIPTAAGTGAEIGRACVMTLENGRICVAVDLNMIADCVICDPELTESLPPDMTAATGIDALSHGIEAYLSTSENPPADAIALDCVARAAKWLKPATENGRNKSARWNMMMAALEGGMVLQKSLGGAHAMATPLEENGIHHGAIIAVVLPHVLRFNARAAAGRIRDLEKAAGTESHLFDWVDMLNKELNLPKRLGELGAQGKDIPKLAELAAKSHLSATNPRRAGVDEYRELYAAAL
ncbi:MAG: iron-containing alcohol dehydrogenase [Albidovulum sp.]|nr:iron-containing alcohol dehydrogenase [Albidovulum sp.]